MPVGMFNHGGHCCGVSHLYLGNSSPDETQDPMEATFDWKSPDKTGRCIVTYGFPSGNNRILLYTGYEPPACVTKRPQESAKDRAESLVAAFRGVRNSGFIEAVTTDFQLSKGWGPILEGLGFTKVGTTTNSNSDNVITMWLLITNPEYNPEQDEPDDDYPDDSWSY